MQRYVSLIAGVSAILFFCSFSFADTVILKNGRKEKGLILDEFKDRIVLSTAEGEKTLMKSDIRSAIYDSEQKALMQKGRNQLKRGQYIKAYYTYEKAVELNPDLKEARERLYYLRNYLETKIRSDVRGSWIARKERFGGASGKTLARKVAGELGLVLASGEKYVFVEKILDSGSPGAKLKLEQGDRIVAVWGEMTAYMDADEVAGMFLGPGETRFVIERTVFPGIAASKTLFGGSLFSGYRKAIGAGLELRKKGVIVSNVIPGGSFRTSGIREGDLLYRINGKNTRYLPMSQIIDIIEKNRNREIEVVIRRDVALWGKGRSE